MAKSDECCGCDWPTCIGCPYNKDEQDDPWHDPDYPEYDPSDG